MVEEKVPSFRIPKVPLVATDIADGAVTTTKIADGAITSAKIADAAITTTKIADSAVTGAKIVDAAITSAKVADGAITTPKIADLAITTSKIVDGAITTPKLVDAAVTISKLAAGIVPSKVTTDHTAANYTLGGGAEQSLASIPGHGAVVVFFNGDGDGALRIRVYVEGTVEEEFPTNEARIGIYAFATGFEIKLYNPGTTSVSGTSTSFSLRGVAR